MNKQTEALKMAIEALETCTEYSGYEYWFDGDVVRNALKIAREALEPQTNPEFDVVYHNVEQEEISDAELVSYRQGYEQGKFDALMDAELKKSVYKFDHPDYGELTQIPEQPAQEPSDEYNLVEILNDPVGQYPHNFMTHAEGNAFLRGLCQEAADEIERLRNRIQPAQWISVKDRLPEVKSGNAKEFIVVIYSGYTGRSFVTSRHFLNKMELYNEYSDNDFDEVSGWHERTYHLEYDDYYTLVDSCNADAVRYEVTHWMPLPDAPKEQA